MHDMPLPLVDISCLCPAMLPDTGSHLIHVTFQGLPGLAHVCQGRKHLVAASMAPGTGSHDDMAALKDVLQGHQHSVHHGVVVCKVRVAPVPVVAGVEHLEAQPKLAAAGPSLG